MTNTPQGQDQDYAAVAAVKAWFRRMWSTRPAVIVLVAAAVIIVISVMVNAAVSSASPVQQCTSQMVSQINAGVPVTQVGDGSACVNLDYGQFQQAIHKLPQ